MPLCTKFCYLDLEIMGGGGTDSTLAISGANTVRGAELEQTVALRLVEGFQMRKLA